MAGKLDQCPRCGKVFASQPDKKLCGQCVALEAETVALIEDAVYHFGIRNPEEIAQFARVSVPEVERIIEDTGILDDPAKQDKQICSRCHENVAQPNTEFCLGCRLALNRELSDATESLTAKVKGKAPDASTVPRQGGPRIPGAPTGLTKTLVTKRQRSSPRGGSYTPKGRYR
jgi:ribosomal protein S27AE